MCVVLTGASGGIGSATACALVAAGARVLLVARSHRALEQLALGLGSAATFLSADITCPQGRASIVTAARATGANVLINNAGLASFGRFQNLGEPHIREVLETNLVAPVLLTRALLEHLGTQPQAAVLNIGSALGSLGLPGFCIYGAAKAGLHGFSEALRRELHGTRIRIQYLGPRATSTSFNDARVDAFNRATGAQSDSPERVAVAILEMLARGTPERFLGFPERYAVRVNGLVPRWLDGAFRRHRTLLTSDSTLP
ncbi:MAG: SDR family oxidoreductase [Burkholderiales bacterium]|nr:SDR family oxidoreductase [Burkholderiales bacterium]